MINGRVVKGNTTCTLLAVRNHRVCVFSVLENRNIKVQKLFQNYFPMSSNVWTVLNYHYYRQ